MWKRFTLQVKRIKLHIETFPNQNQSFEGKFDILHHLYEVLENGEEKQISCFKYIMRISNTPDDYEEILMY